ncbi:hypothetical protein A6S26_23080 [Nostoc sp. ATCC 43529]|nr:hypothetical protein A6S26_23080 [Nostoc sp. ATCC 43529]
MKNFSLSLYAFHLRHTLTDGASKVDENANLLWENLAQLGKNSLCFPGLKDLRSNLVCYEYEKNEYVYKPKPEEGRLTQWLSDVGELDLGIIPTLGGFKINAKLQPFLFKNTYIADLSLLPEPRNISINVQQLQYFKPSCLLPSKIQGSLGQTLLIYGEVEPYKNCEALAKEFSSALVEGTNLKPVLTNQGKLFGSFLFEYQAPDPDEPDNPAKQCHILIVLNNSYSPTVELFGKAYDWLTNLFCSYHKILFEYHKAEQRYQEAIEVYSYLENTIQKFNGLAKESKNRLPELKKLLAEIPQKSLDYTRCLQDLETDYTTISTNITNYKICLDNITAIGSANNTQPWQDFLSKIGLDKIIAIDEANSPQCWRDFLNKDCKKYQEQIQINIKYLVPGQEIFRQTVETIRGVVEIQQAESDRSLERTIQVLGVGFGGGAIISGIATEHIKEVNIPLIHIYIKNPVSASIFWSAVATLGFTMFALLVTERKWFWLKQIVRYFRKK